MKRLLATCVSLVLAATAMATSPQALRKQAEASMLVTGNIQVAPDGSVSSYTLDHADEVPAMVTDLIKRGTQAWHFQMPPNAAPITAKMSIRMLAKPDGNGNYTVSIAGANFGEYHPDNERISSKQMQPPRYPEAAIRGRVAGTVFLLVRVGKDGHVTDAAAEQVNLEVVDTDAGMTRWRKALADSAIKAAMAWTYNIPTQGKSANAPFYLVRVPVNYNLNVLGAKLDHYGQWVGYIPGPHESVPWFEDYKNQHKMGAFNDALPNGGTFLVDDSLKLTTPLGSS
ncbi:energy transducer TonB [Dyella sp.]|uniref:energy transducer TonB n=1 Tax=Dyella sp. TaxID=1869338 RepID=UPI002ED51FD6